MTTCPKCGVVVQEDMSFCQECGTQLIEGAERKEAPRKKLGSLATQQHQQHIKSARGIIMFVAIVTLIFAAYQWYTLSDIIQKFETDLAKLRNDPTMIVDENVVKQNRDIFATAKMQVFGIAITGFIFFGIFFWVPHNPFAACLTALIIYVASHLVDAVLDPTSLQRGIIIKILFVIALTQGVKSGLAYKRLQEKS